MSKILYEEQTPYFFIGKCFDLTRSIELAYLSQFHKINDLKKFQEKLVEAEKYFWLRQSAQNISEQQTIVTGLFPEEHVRDAFLVLRRFLFDTRRACSRFQSSDTTPVSAYVPPILKGRYLPVFRGLSNRCFRYFYHRC